MNKNLSTVFRKRTSLSVCLALVLALSLTACAAPAPVTMPPAAQSVPVAEESPVVTIYAPGTPSSVPVILAAKSMDNARVTIFSNHSQANTLFLRGEVNILSTGLSVGVDMFRNEAPVQAVNSYVSSLSSLVTRGRKVEKFTDLERGEIYIPFEGSPIEEVTAFLVSQEGLTWKEDVTPVYSPFESSVELLRQGKADAVVLPEPFVSMLEGTDGMYVSMDFAEKWNKATGTDAGYPQVATFVMRDWAGQHPAEITEFNAALREAVERVESDPEAAVEAVKGEMKVPAPVLLKALKRTKFDLVTDEALQEQIENYYRTIGKPRDEKFSAFYYCAEK